MNDWRTTLTSLRTTLAGVQNAATSPQVDALQTAFARFKEVLQEAATGDGWKTSLDGVSAVAMLMEGLNDALKPLDPKQVRRRERSLAAEPEGIVKPEEGDLPDTPEEEEDVNPFSGIFARSSPSAVKHEPFLAPSASPSTDRQPSPAAPSPSSPAVKRELSPSLRISPSARTPSPAPPAPSAASSSNFLNPLDLPLSRFSAVPVPSELMDSVTGLPVFHGPFIRQGNPLLRRHSRSWNDIIGGGCSQTITGTIIGANEWYFNVPPIAPGHPFSAFHGEWWHNEIMKRQVQRFSVFFKFKFTEGWHYQGEYELALDDLQTINGSQLAQLNAEQKARWIDMFSPEAKEGQDRLLRIQEWCGLREGLWGEEVWDDAVASGAAAEFDYVVFRCVGFDAAKVAGWVAKRQQRFVLEDELSLLPAPPKKAKAAPKKKPKKQPGNGGKKGTDSGKGKGKGRRQVEEDTEDEDDEKYEEDEEAEEDESMDLDDEEVEDDAETVEGEGEEREEAQVEAGAKVEHDDPGDEATEEEPKERRKRSGR